MRKLDIGYWVLGIGLVCALWAAGVGGASAFLSPVSPVATPEADQPMWALPVKESPKAVVEKMQPPEVLPVTGMGRILAWVTICACGLALVGIGLLAKRMLKR